jgi:hypothetical protein
MGILLVYDCTNKNSFQNVRKQPDARAMRCQPQQFAPRCTSIVTLRPTWFLAS